MYLTSNKYVKITYLRITIIPDKKNRQKNSDLETISAKYINV